MRGKKHALVHLGLRIEMPCQSFLLSFQAVVAFSVDQLTQKYPKSGEQPDFLRAKFHSVSKSLLRYSKKLNVF